MSATLEGIDEASMKSLVLRVLSWRVGDMQDLPAQLVESFSISEYEVYQLIELICLALDSILNENVKNANEVHVDKKLNEATQEKLKSVVFANKDKCLSFCREHAPSISRVLYHDWKTSMQVATESLGRIARPIASITLRVQPASEGSCILPPLKSVSMDLSKDMIDALASGFDRLQNQLVKIVQ